MAGHFLTVDSKVLKIPSKSLGHWACITALTSFSPSLLLALNTAATLVSRNFLKPTQQTPMYKTVLLRSSVPRMLLSPIAVWPAPTLQVFAQILPSQ